MHSRLWLACTKRMLCLKIWGAKCSDTTYNWYVLVSTRRTTMVRHLFCHALFEFLGDLCVSTIWLTTRLVNLLLPFRIENTGECSKFYLKLNWSASLFLWHLYDSTAWSNLCVCVCIISTHQQYVYPSTQWFRFRFTTLYRHPTLCHSHQVKCDRQLLVSRTFTKTYPSCRHHIPMSSSTSFPLSIVFVTDRAISTPILHLCVWPGHVWCAWVRWWPIIACHSRCTSPNVEPIGTRQCIGCLKVNYSKVS